MSEYWELLHIQGLDEIETADLELYEVVTMESNSMITNVDGGKGSGNPAWLSQTIDIVPIVSAISSFIDADKSWIGDMWDWVLGLIGIEPDMPVLPAIVEAFPEIAAMVEGGSGAMVAAKVAEVVAYGLGKMAIELGQEQLKEWIQRKLDGVSESPEKNLELIRQQLQTEDDSGNVCDPPVPIGSLLQAINKRLSILKESDPRGSLIMPLGTFDVENEEPRPLGDEITEIAINSNNEGIIEIDGTRVWTHSKVLDTQ